MHHFWQWWLIFRDHRSPYITSSQFQNFFPDASYLPMLISSRKVFLSILFKKNQIIVFLFLVISNRKLVCFSPQCAPCSLLLLTRLQGNLIHMQVKLTQLLALAFSPASMWVQYILGAQQMLNVSFLSSLGLSCLIWQLRQFLLVAGAIRWLAL